MTNAFEHLHPMMLDLALAHWELLTGLLKQHYPEVSARVTSVWRSPEHQMELYAKGRRLVGGVWQRTGKNDKIVTNALPEQTPHCHVRKNKTPASLAYDILLLQDKLILRDNDIAWHLIPATAALVGKNLLRTGADFRTVRDFPHTEWADWKKIDD